MTKLAFIMAASHSGSTLLAMLLGSHAQATTIGDTGGTLHRKDANYRCSCGRKPLACPFWSRVIEEMAHRGFDLDVTDFGTRFEYPENRLIDRVLHAEHRGPIFEKIRDSIFWLNAGWRRQYRSIAERNVTLVETVTKETNSQILVDSSKLPRRLKYLLRIPDLEVKVIHLVRDGRGVVHTYIHDNGWSVEKSAIEWRLGVIAEEKLLARLDKSMWRQIRYEDLCSNPKNELEKLYVFLGLDPSQVNLDFRSAGLHIFGNKMRLSSEQAIRLDDKWQTELTHSQISTIERLAGRQLMKYGYSVNGI